MDKERFLDIAPHYYALAIAVYFFDSQSARRSKIINFYRHDDDFSSAKILRLRDNMLLDKGLELLKTSEILELIEDDFGPTIITKPANFLEKWQLMSDTMTGTFGKYNRLGDDGYLWLLSALDKLNQTYDDLNISDNDFIEPDRDWAPLPLDRTNLALQDAIENLEDTISKVEQDNGYAANIPEERSYVLDSLKQTLKRLKTDSQISFGYLRKNAFAPLVTITKRFAGAAIGATATGAAAALIEFLTNSGAGAMSAALKAMFGM